MNNSKSQLNSYGLITRYIHWFMAILILLNFIIGITLNNNGLYTIHKQIGALVLLLILFRIIWRILTPYPAMLNTLTKFEIFTSNLVHKLLYILMFLLPISGILMVQGWGGKISIFGLFYLPKLINKNPHLGELFSQMHVVLAFTIIIIASLHALAALKHHFINKDNVLKRMWKNLN